jgi:hypothetical protein
VKEGFEEIVPDLRLKADNKAKDQRKQERQVEVLSKSTQGIVSAGRLLKHKARDSDQN